MRNLKIWTLAGLLLAAPAAVRAEGGSAGAEPLGALFLDGNARPSAMGGAYSSLAEDANALIYNPAGLARVRKNEATFMHNQYLQGLTQEYMAVATKWGWGAAVNYAHLGNITRTTIRDQDETLDKFALSAMTLSGGYGYTFFDNLSVGATAKVIRESIDDVSAHAFAGDAGVLYSVPGYRGLNLGASFQNIGPRVRFDRDAERLPTLFRGGASYAFKVMEYDSTVAVDLIKDLHGKARVGLGGETVWRKCVRVAGRATMPTTESPRALALPPSTSIISCLRELAYPPPERHGPLGEAKCQGPGPGPRPSPFKEEPAEREVRTSRAFRAQPSR